LARPDVADHYLAPSPQDTSMSEEIDIPEPEHDHLLDHEFHDHESWAEEDAQGVYDDVDDEDEEPDAFDFLDQVED
jgi:hypothetical protein